MNPKTNLFLFLAVLVIGIITFSESSVFDLLFSQTDHTEINVKGAFSWGIFFGGCISAIIVQIGKLRNKSLK